jgi:hypothetical protein
MNNTQHTPGPWSLEDRGTKFIVSKPGDGYITREVCRMDSSTMAAFAQEANARLIAAAPDLLEALQAIASIDVHSALTEAEADAIHAAASAAIAKATGETK